MFLYIISVDINFAIFFGFDFLYNIIYAMIPKKDFYVSQGKASFETHR